MIKEVKKAISEIIENSLSEEVGEKLREVLKQAESDAKKCKHLEKIISQNEETIKDLWAKIASLKTNNLQLEEEIERYQKQEESIQNTLALLDQRERDLQLEIRDIQLEEANRRCDTVIKLVATLVKNPTFRKSILENGGEKTIDIKSKEQ